MIFWVDSDNVANNVLSKILLWKRDFGTDSNVGMKKNLDLTCNGEK